MHPDLYREGKLAQPWEKAGHPPDAGRLATTLLDHST